MNLIMASSVNPTILNGRRISQTKGNNTSITMATGQHNTSSMHHRMNPVNILMLIATQNFRHSKKCSLDSEFKEFKMVIGQT